MHKIIFILVFGFYAIVDAGAATLPDPTRPPDYLAARPVIQVPQKDGVTFNLTAIRIDEHERSVIINGKLLRKGQEIDSARILEIHPAHVVLDHKDEQLIVRLYSRLNKQDSGSDRRMKITN